MSSLLEMGASFVASDEASFLKKQKHYLDFAAAAYEALNPLIVEIAECLKSDSLRLEQPTIITPSGITSIRDVIRVEMNLTIIASRKQPLFSRIFGSDSIEYHRKPVGNLTVNREYSSVIQQSEYGAWLCKKEDHFTCGYKHGREREPGSTYPAQINYKAIEAIKNGLRQECSRPLVLGKLDFLKDGPK